MEDTAREALSRIDDAARRLKAAAPPASSPEVAELEALEHARAEVRRAREEVDRIGERLEAVLGRGGARPRC